MAEINEVVLDIMTLCCRLYQFTLFEYVNLNSGWRELKKSAVVRNVRFQTLS